MKKGLYITVNAVLIFILLTAGIYGYINKDKKNNNQKKEITNTEKIDTSTTLSAKDITYLKNIVTSIFNDSYKFLTFKSDEGVIVSEEGKITSAAKVMYLNGEFTNTKKITEAEKTTIVNKANELYNSKITYKDFEINYSNEYCGVGGYISTKGIQRITDTTASGKCTLPFMLFETKDIKKTNENQYTAKVINAFVEQKDITTEQTCKADETKYGKIITAFSDYQKKNNIYSSKVSGCAKTNLGETIAIFNEKDKIMNIANESNSYYSFVFTKENNVYKLNSITKVK